jgi:lantibiotic modifying enzyme
MDKSPLKVHLNKRSEDHLQRIANVLLLNSSFIENLGLLNGKMGISIFFYKYGSYLDNKIYTDYAGELIDEIYEEVNTNTSIDFANGLAGIGWGIEYLAKHKYIESNTDEALEDMDNVIYRSLLSNPLLFESETT